MNLVYQDLQAYRDQLDLLAREENQDKEENLEALDLQDLWVLLDQVD